MKWIIKNMLVSTLGLGAMACNSDKKKPDAVVISNKDADKAKEGNVSEEAATDTADLTTAYQDTGMENYAVDETQNGVSDNPSALPV
jgi:hypothetical protein